MTTNYGSCGVSNGASHSSHESSPQGSGHWFGSTASRPRCYESGGHGAFGGYGGAGSCGSHMSHAGAGSCSTHGAFGGNGGFGRMGGQGGFGGPVTFGGNGGNGGRGGWGHPMGSRPYPSTQWGPGWGN